MTSILCAVFMMTLTTGSRSCSENDLILLTRQPLKNSSHEVHKVGKVSFNLFMYILLTANGSHGLKAMTINC